METRAKIVCPINATEYHCMYDTECQLVEDYVPVIQTNNPDYHKLQEATKCKTNGNNSSSVGDSVCNGDTSHTEICCVLGVVSSLVLPGIIIYMCVYFEPQKEAYRPLIEKDKEIERLNEEVFNLKVLLKEKDDEQNLIMDRLKQESSKVGKTMPVLQQY
ncbi:unnamed protein product [Mytilus edulis]|uniref:Uncharacterized protein n=1 Tax=Mytilus edulis TaxID=6550 RepID=A0A8S3SQ64_MYTED|nr:unnamed protein product [Mytilus edulis]